MRKRSKRERTCSAGTSPRPGPGTRSAGTPPWPPSPSSAAPPSATPWAAASTLPAAGAAGDRGTSGSDRDINDADLQHPPRRRARPGPRRPALPAPASPRSGCPSPRPPGSTGLAGAGAAGLITRARLAFALRWSRLAQAAPGRRPLAPLQRPAGRGGSLTPDGRKEVTACNQDRQPGHHGTLYRQISS